MALFPATAVADITAGFIGVLTANMAVVLGVLAFAWGVNFVTRKLGKSTRGRI